MANVIGPKGQLVIEKQIRDRLGVGPGWKAIQRIVDDHVELHFIPPTHNRSLGGCLKSLIDPSKLEPTDEELEQAIEAAVGEACREEEVQLLADWAARQRSNSDP
jgi:bifunctional DNA-binding transcriptional regulator/antitoxin component of YhaV-PrlF toxin-antitoxin module